MTSIVFTEQALTDMDRLCDFLIENYPRQALATHGLIWQALQILKNHPEIGRPAALAPYRELVISRGKSGYLALYNFDPVDNSILVLAIRHQRESGYKSVSSSLENNDE